jgi:hypothetical protein
MPTDGRSIIAAEFPDLVLCGSYYTHHLPEQFKVEVPQVGKLVDGDRGVDDRRFVQRSNNPWGTARRGRCGSR